MDTLQPSEQTIQAKVTIVTLGAPWVQPDVAWILEIPILQSQRQALTEETRSIVRANGHVSHVFKYRGGQTSWGGVADEYHEVLLFVSSHAGDAAFGALVGALFKSLGERFQRHSDKPSEPPLGREEAVERARWLIAESFQTADGRRQTEPDALSVVAEDHDIAMGQWTIMFESTNGSKYEATLSLTEGLPFATRVKRYGP